MTHTPTGDECYQKNSPPNNYNPPKGHRTRCLNNTRTITKRGHGLFKNAAYKSTSNRGTAILGTSITTHHPGTWITLQTPCNITDPPSNPKPHRRHTPLSTEQDGLMIITLQVPLRATGGDYLTCLQKSSSKYWDTYLSNNA